MISDGQIRSLQAGWQTDALIAKYIFKAPWQDSNPNYLGTPNYSSNIHAHSMVFEKIQKPNMESFAFTAGKESRLLGRALQQSGDQWVAGMQFLDSDKVARWWGPTMAVADTPALAICKSALLAELQNYER